MTVEQETKHAVARSLSNGGLGIPPVAWRRTDTPRTVVTENEDVARLWALDELFFEALVPKKVADAEIVRLRTIFRVNILRLSPDTSHEEIDRILTTPNV